MTPPADAPTAVTFYLDPGCPWTWLSAGWLLDVAAQRDLTVRWRTFSLAMLHEGRPVPPQFDTPEHRAGKAVAGQALRVVQAAADAGDDAAGGRFYLEFGRRFHGSGAHPDVAMVADAAEAAGAMPMLEAAADPGLDGAIAASLQTALDLAGPDIGSPVLHVDGTSRGFFGPIVSPAPTGEEALRLWDAIVVLSTSPSFFEIKRGRSGKASDEDLQAAGRTG